MNIRVDLNTNIADGSEVVFRSPADCSKVTGLLVYHNGGRTEFAFADAHGNNVGDIDHIFAENAVVKVILDVTTSKAFVQNADTNAYIERTFVKTVNGQAPDEKGNVEATNHEGGNGADGYTPVRGEDFFTPEDVADIVSKASAEATAAAVDEALSVMRAPTLYAKRGWYQVTEGTGEDKVVTRGTTFDKAQITEIHIVDSYTPHEGSEPEKWNADENETGEIKCYRDGTVLTIAGNGSGRIMANADSSVMFGSFTGVTEITGLSLIDTRNALSLRQSLANIPRVRSLTGFEGWNVRKCVDFNCFVKQPNGNDFEGTLDFSRWDVSNAVQAAIMEKASKPETEWVKPLHCMIQGCRGAESISFNKSFDFAVNLLFLPQNLEGEAWMDAATGDKYYDVDGNEMIDDRDGFPNPAAVGRNVTVIAVSDESEEVTV